ncbi:MAG: hypothetical protein R3308_10620, partial [Thiohalobacterales bacterium]|nr:hypothetical protein [Thiohalobacterales bacterium]
QTVVLTAGEIPQLSQPGRCAEPGHVTNVASTEGDSVDTGNTVSDSDPAVVLCNEEPGGGEGCTPGFWKNRTEFWPISTDAVFSDYFSCPAFDGNDSLLLDVLAAGGGGLNALGRHASAALLNSLSDHVSYDLSTAAIISSVDAACASGDGSQVELLKDDLDDFNNQGCLVPERARMEAESSDDAVSVSNGNGKGALRSAIARANNKGKAGLSED